MADEGDLPALRLETLHDLDFLSRQHLGVWSSSPATRYGAIG
jgi:hypothetical protein